MLPVLMRGSSLVRMGGSWEEANTRGFGEKQSALQLSSKQPHHYLGIRGLTEVSSHVLWDKRKGRGERKEGRLQGCKSWLCLDTNCCVGEAPGKI